MNTPNNVPSPQNQATHTDEVGVSKTTTWLFRLVSILYAVLIPPSLVMAGFMFVLLPSLTTDKFDDTLVNWMNFLIPVVLIVCAIGTWIMATKSATNKWLSRFFLFFPVLYGITILFFYA